MQRKRFSQLEEARRHDILLKLKEDRLIGKEILSTLKSAGPVVSRNASSSSFGLKTSDVSHFMVLIQYF